MTLEVGLELEKYKVLRELGRGGMGVVYLAEDKQLNRHVALKVLYEHLYRESSFVERFREEARSVSSLHHPNIVCVHGLENSGEMLAIDMEYVEGYSLDQHTTNSRVTPHVAVAIARDVLSGLATCHHIGIVHRDIKPSNILIHETGVAKLTDFGLATAYACHLEDTVKGSTSTGFYMGTPRYMPAKAWEGGEPDPAWDTYALGVVLYEMLSGTVAYPGDNPLAIMKRHLTDPLPSIGTTRDGLSQALIDLVDELVKEPEDGGLSSDEALRRLQGTPEYGALKDSDGAPTISVPKLRRLRRRGGHMKTRPFWARMSLAVVSVMLLGALGWVAVQNGVGPVINMPPDVAFMEVREMGSERVESWMVEQEGQQGGYVLTGYSERGLSRLHLKPEARGDWVATGGWAEYVAAAAGSMQFGALSGAVHWVPGETMTLRITRTREKDNEQNELTLVGRPESGVMTRERFLRRLEARSALQSLIYVELLPRDLAWAAEIEALFPAHEKTRFDVPRSTHAVEVDGYLDEAAWTMSYFLDGRKRVGVFPPNRLNARADVRMRWNDDVVVLGARIAANATDLQWELAIQPDFEISADMAEKLLVRVGADGKTQFRSFRGLDERPERFSWPVAVSQEGDESIVEMAIPGTLLIRDTSEKIVERWRINLQCFRESLDTGRTVVAQWGDDDMLALQHGALLLFQSNVVESSEER